MRNEHPTRLSLFCEQIIEGCWLIALVVVPLFFNVYSNRIFEPDKTAMLRSIVLIMGLAWIVRGLDQWAATRSNQERSNDGSIWRRSAAVPVLSLALLFLMDYAFATLISISPRVSLFGSYARLQGLYTTTAYLGVFLSILALMRTRAQLDRLILAALVVSLPVSLYGIIQYFGTDPHLWGSNVMVRVASSMGNPIFVAAFLIMTVPLSLYRLFVSGSAAAENESIGTTRVLVGGGLISLAFQMAAWQAGPTAGTVSVVITMATWVVIAFLLGKPPIPFLRISSYTVLLSTQLMCILFSRSRGPWIALAIGLFVFALLWSLVQRRRKQAAFVIGSGLMVALFLVVLNWPGSPLEIARDVPNVGRVAQLSNTSSGSGRVRVLIWEGIQDLLTVNPVRTVVGYGPETLQLVYPPHYRPELRHVQGNASMADRSHNETFDVLVTTGLIGFVIYILLFTSVLYYGLRRLDLMETSLQRQVFLWLWFGGAVSGTLLVLAIDGSWRFAGLSIPAGMIFGLLVYLCGRSIFVTTDRSSESAGEPVQLIVVALLAALVAHFVEIQLGPAVVATRTYFWSYAGMLAALAFLDRHRAGLAEIVHPVAAVASASGATRPFARGPLVASSLVAGFILITLGYDFVIPHRLGDASIVFWMMVFSWALTGFLITTELRPKDHSVANFSAWFRRFGVYSGVTLIMVLVYASIYAGIVRYVDDVANMGLIYPAALLLTILGLGFALLWDEPLSDRTSVRWLWIPYLMLAAGIMAVVYTTNLNVVRGDVYFKQASQLQRQGLQDQAAVFYRRALALQPDQDMYHLGLGQSLFQKAESSEDAEALLQDSERALRTAQTLSPLNPDHSANLGRLFQAMAQRSEDPAKRAGQLRQALTFFEHAATLSPNTALLWNEVGTTYALMGDTTEARRIYQHSLQVDDAVYQTHLLIANLDFAQKRWGDAARGYERVIELEPGLQQVHLALEIAKGQIDR